MYVLVLVTTLRPPLSLGNQRLLIHLSSVLVNCVFSRGVCPKCQTQMDSLELSEGDMAVLRAKLFDVNFLSSVYATTTPQELDNFSFYLQRQKPYDIVVDGLNIMYRRTQLCDWRAANKLNTSMVSQSLCHANNSYPLIGHILFSCC